MITAVETIYSIAGIDPEVAVATQHHGQTLFNVAMGLSPRQGALVHDFVERQRKPH